MRCANHGLMNVYKIVENEIFFQHFCECKKCGYRGSELIMKPQRTQNEFKRPKTGFDSRSKIRG